MKSLINPFSVLRCLDLWSVATFESNGDGGGGGGGGDDSGGGISTPVTPVTTVPTVPVYDNYYDAIDAEGAGATVNIGGNIVKAETADGYTGSGTYDNNPGQGKMDADLGYGGTYDYGGGSDSSSDLDAFGGAGADIDTGSSSVATTPTYGGTGSSVYTGGSDPDTGGFTTTDLDPFGGAGPDIDTNSNIGGDNDSYGIGYGVGEVDPGLADAIPGGSDYVADSSAGTVTYDPIISTGTGTSGLDESDPLDPFGGSGASIGDNIGTADTGGIDLDPFGGSGIDIDIDPYVPPVLDDPYEEPYVPPVLDDPYEEPYVPPVYYDDLGNTHGTQGSADAANEAEEARITEEARVAEESRIAEEARVAREQALQVSLSSDPYSIDTVSNSNVYDSDPLDPFGGSGDPYSPPDSFDPIVSGGTDDITGVDSRFEGVPTPRGVDDSPRLSESTVTPSYDNSALDFDDPVLDLDLGDPLEAFGGSGDPIDEMLADLGINLETDSTGANRGITLARGTGNVTPAAITELAMGGEDYTPSGDELTAQLDALGQPDMRESQFDVDMSQPKVPNAMTEDVLSEVEAIRNETRQDLADGEIDSARMQEILSSIDDLERDMLEDSFDQNDRFRGYDENYSARDSLRDQKLAGDFDGTILGKGEGGLEIPTSGESLTDDTLGTSPSFETQEEAIDRALREALGDDIPTENEISGLGSFENILNTQPIDQSEKNVISNTIKELEGFSDDTYYDVNADRAGYGSDTKTDPVTGEVTKITEGMTVTREEAEADLNRRLTTEFIPSVVDVVGADTFYSMPPTTQAALTSIAYNYGAGWADKLPTLAAAAASGDTNAIADAIEDRSVDNEGINAGRRTREADMVRTGVPLGGDVDPYTGNALSGSLTGASTSNTGVPTAEDISGGSGGSSTDLYLSAMAKIEDRDPNAEVEVLTEAEQRALYGSRGQTPNDAETAYLQDLLGDAKHAEDGPIDNRRKIDTDFDPDGLTIAQGGGIDNPDFGKPMYKAGDDITPETFGEQAVDFGLGLVETLYNPLSILGDKFTIAGQLEGVKDKRTEEQLEAYKNGGTFVYGGVEASDISDGVAGDEAFNEMINTYDGSLTEGTPLYEDGDDISSGFVEGYDSPGGATVVGIAEPNYDASGDGNNDTVVLYDENGDFSVTGDGIAVEDVIASNNNSDGEDFDIDIVDSDKTYTNTEDGVVETSTASDVTEGSNDSGDLGDSDNICEAGFEFDPVEGICMPIDTIGDGTKPITIKDRPIIDDGRDVKIAPLPRPTTGGVKVRTPGFNKGGFVSNFAIGGAVTPNIDNFFNGLR